MRFVIPDEPVATARPRVAVRGGRPHAYQPKKTSEAQWRIRTYVMAELGVNWVPLAGPLRVRVEIYVRMPANIPKKHRDTARPAKRPDIDNYIKTALDGCNPIWIDDAQVVSLTAEKFYAVEAAPHWIIEVGEA